MWGKTNREENIEQLDKEIEKWCKAKKVRSKLQGRLTDARLKESSGFPKLKAKAAATRHLSLFALDLAQKHCSPKVVAVTQLLCEFYTLIEGESLHMRDFVLKRMPALGQDLCNIYASLSREALQGTPKRKE